MGGVTSALAAVLVFHGVAHASERELDVPFRLLKGYAILVQGSIGKMGPLNFVIDTGTLPSVVDGRVARKLNLRGENEYLQAFTRNVNSERVVLPELRLGPIRREALEVLVSDLKLLERGLGVRVDALIGFDVFDGRNFSLDFASSRLKFGRIERGDGEVPFEPDLPGVVVRVVTWGAPLRLLMDTGAKDVILFESRVRHRLPASAIGETKTIHNLAGEVALRRVPLRNMRLGGLPLHFVLAFVAESGDDAPPGFDGLLGIAALDLKQLDFDFERRTVGWRR
jgi:predicted aspartyl protease